MNGRKGVIVGISAVVCTSLAVAIAVAGGLKPQSLIPFSPNPMVAGGTTLIFGLAVGAIFGGLLGGLTIDVPRYARIVTFIIVALSALLLCLPFAPGLAPIAAPITIVHAIALARWTAPGEPLPQAIVRRRR